MTLKKLLKYMTMRLSSIVIVFVELQGFYETLSLGNVEVVHVNTTDLSNMSSLKEIDIWNLCKNNPQDTNNNPATKL